MKASFLENILVSKAQKAELAHFYTITPSNESISVSDFIQSTLLKIISKTDVVSLANHPDILQVSTTANSYTLAHEDFLDFFDFLKTRPLFLKQKIVYIQDAHKVNLVLWNKLLKTLEEPEIDVSIFLLNPLRANFLATINSRTINITLDSDSGPSTPKTSDFLKSIAHSEHFTDKSFLEFLKNQSIAKLLLDMKARDFSEDLFMGHWIRLANELSLDHKQYEEVIQTLKDYKLYKDFNNSQTFRLVFLCSMLKDKISGQV